MKLLMVMGLSALAAGVPGWQLGATGRPHVAVPGDGTVKAPHALRL
jgi:hypothetical protein